MGKYGYVDDLGKVRVVEYGANKYGFQPAGEGITVAAPTLVDETKRRDGEVTEYDDGQYYEQAPPARPASASRFSHSRPAPAPRPTPRPAPPPPSYETYETEQSYSAPDPAPAPRPRPSAPRPSGGSSLGPVPPRAQIPGAIPAGGSSSGIVYSQPRPSAPRPSIFSQPSQSAPRPSIFSQPSQSAPVYQAPRPQARHTSGGGGLLDQLAKDYALPPGGQPLHDITFGYY
ncbi:hypothetical protein C0J52_06042 [Blattella germanica]|nr:hypothetical protein C0J52_06042 [Blattella germanica]